MKRNINPFENKYNHEEDLKLIDEILSGKKGALEKLLQKHQIFIYNIALKFYNHIQDAEDATQEVLIKLISNIGSYDKDKSKFRTWLYRVSFNHFLNTKKKATESRYEIGFEAFFNVVQSAPDEVLSEEEMDHMKWEIEESKVACMAGMIMCLNREQRLVYIVGEVFEMSSDLGGEIFEISPENYRKRLSRAKKDLYQWMHQRCGLVNPENPCRCPKKTKGFIKAGYVNPESLKWHSDFLERIHETTRTKIDDTLNERDRIYASIFKEHPFKTPSISTEKIIDTIVNNKTFGGRFNL